MAIDLCKEHEEDRTPLDGIFQAGDQTDALWARSRGEPGFLWIVTICRQMTGDGHEGPSKVRVDTEAAPRSKSAACVAGVVASQTSLYR